MLEKLSIRNVAVIEQAEIDFDHGLNVLTGETGAGKSILIDAINLVLGMRSSREIIRTGATTASVTAVFSVSPETILPGEVVADEDGTLILERTVTADGRGSARINGRTVSVTQLRETGEKLAGIHGQHDNGALLDPERHIDFLDAYADNDILLSAYKEDYAKLKHLAEKIRSLKLESRDKERRLDLLRYQVKEIDDAALTEGEEERLLELRRRIQNGERRAEALSGAVSALAGDEEETAGAEELLRRASEILEPVLSLDEAVGSVRERIVNAAYEMADCLSELREMLSETGLADMDPAQVEARLDVIHRLKSKYGESYEAIMTYRDEAAAELEEHDNKDELIARLTEEYGTLRSETQTYAASLSATRKEASDSLCKRVREELTFLNMPGAVFFANVVPAGVLLPTGADVVEFMLSANAGEQPRPLIKIASGGELSRIMLAIKNALSERDGIPTQIFDEIDTGVSGRAAQRIGIKLKQISVGQQILCVTHLAQIAAYADRHLLIEKSSEQGRTFTRITPLDRPGRIRELARIMSGEAAGDAARVGAEELLAYAETKEE